MPYASSFPRMPEWVQLHNGVSSHQLQAVTAHLFRYGQPEANFRWVGPTGLVPDATGLVPDDAEEEEEEAPRSRLFEGLPVDSTPRAARPNRAAPSRARSRAASIHVCNPAPRCYSDANPRGQTVWRGQWTIVYAASTFQIKPTANRAARHR